MTVPRIDPWQRDDPPERPRSSTFQNLLPWPLVILAAAPVLLSVYYLTQVAPARLPLPAGVKSPFPAAMPFLTEMCLWCGKNQLTVLCIGISLLLLGLLSRFLADRYYLALAILASLGLGFVYYQVSAPVERLIDSVEESLPRDRRVPRSR